MKDETLLVFALTTLFWCVMWSHIVRKVSDDYEQKIEQTMDNENKKLLEIYMKGFNDELYGIVDDTIEAGLTRSAYELGRVDAVVGDDVSSNDMRSEDQIIKDIHTYFKNTK